MLFNIAGENYQVPTLWEIVRDLRKRVTANLTSLPEEVRDGAVLTATELAENLVKYAVQDPLDPPTLSVNLEENVLAIRSENIIPTEIHGANVIKVVKTIADHPDPMELYAEAIAETLDRRVSGSQQGFFRIAAIAEFQIDASIVGNKLVIVATRNV